MVGLDAAGKTTILYKLKLGEGQFYSINVICDTEQLSCSSPLLISKFVDYTAVFFMSQL